MTESIAEILIGSIIAFLALLAIGVVLMCVVGCYGGSHECSMKGVGDVDLEETLRNLNTNRGEDD